MANDILDTIANEDNPSSFAESTEQASSRQDIAMPEEQSMIDVNNQRQLIGSLGASTEFADNVGGMGLGHPGVPHMSSGVSGIPGEYSGHGGFGHGWDGESPIYNDHGWGYGGGYGGGHRRMEMPAVSQGMLFGHHFDWIF